LPPDPASSPLPYTTLFRSSGWTERYEAAFVEVLPDWDEVVEWLVDQQPQDSGDALVHNDYKYDNLVLDPENLAHIRAVLDWEMADRKSTRLNSSHVKISYA